MLNGIAWDPEGKRIFANHSAFHFSTRQDLELVELDSYISTDIHPILVAYSYVHWTKVTGKLWPEMYEIKLEPASGLTLERARRVCIPRTNIFRPR